LENEGSWRLELQLQCKPFNDEFIDIHPLKFFTFEPNNFPLVLHYFFSLFSFIKKYDLKFPIQRGILLVNINIIFFEERAFKSKEFIKKKWNGISFTPNFSFFAYSEKYSEVAIRRQDGFEFRRVGSVWLFRRNRIDQIGSIYILYFFQIFDWFRLGYRPFDFGSDWNGSSSN
jgi:hypothetical protein